MAKLNPGWLTESLIDPEYKKYILLAYLKSVKENFDQKRLFPDLKEIRHHYDASMDLQDKKRNMRSLFPGKVTDISLSDLKIGKKTETEDDMELLDVILDYAIPRFRYMVGIGSEIDERVSESIRISPVGLVPLHLDEGYILLYEQLVRETRIYRYRLTIFESAGEQHRSVSTTYIDSTKNSLANSFENIKLQLIRKDRSIPNPATYLVESGESYPLEETLLPIVKRKVVQYISTFS